MTRSIGSNSNVAGEGGGGREGGCVAGVFNGCGSGAARGYEKAIRCVCKGFAGAGLPATWRAKAKFGMRCLKAIETDSTGPRDVAIRAQKSLDPDAGGSMW